MQLSAKTPRFPGYMGGDKEGGNEPYLPENDLTLNVGSYQPLGWFRIGTDMPRKPGNLNPDSQAGNARLGTGRGSNAGRSQPLPKGSVPTPKRFTAPISDPFSKNPAHLRSEAEKLLRMSESAKRVEAARLRYAANNLILRARGLEKKAK